MATWPHPATAPRAISPLLLQVIPLACLLASCATPARPPAALAERASIPQGVLIPGTLVAIRPLTAEAALPAGSADVLAALQLSAPAQQPNATEFVIQRSDGSVASIVLPSPASSPGASLAASDFAVGDQVELITGRQTELIHRNP